MNNEDTFERRLFQPSEENRCTICGTTRDVHKYEGEWYCDQHLQNKMAQQI